MDEQQDLAGSPGASREAIEKTLRYALEIVSDGIWDWDIRSDDVKRSPGWYRMLGYPLDGLPESVATWHSVIHPDDFPQVMRGFQAYLDGSQATYAEEYRCRCANGDYLWIRDHGRFVEFAEDGSATRMIGAHHNIHERKLIELELQRRNEELRELNHNLEQLVAQRTEALRRANLALAEQAAVAVRLSETDPLTQIHNRRRFEGSLQHEWQRFQRHGYDVSVLMFDLDHFKRINDSLGHPAGDQVLVAVTQAVRHSLREQDCFARWGGEEFVVLLPNTPLVAAGALAERLRLLIGAAGGDLFPPLTASFALAGMRRGEPLEQLLRRLDDGLYRAKRQRDCIEVC
ncbi:sensor domain-containing diguanylate cyclase [Pseudomonas citronellolis]|uniref:sensor domain-containing diguanylate cyclase n=1 Tax=Pseudomonas citronellolis TaxID=53408 RepID=UPI0023E443DA|nr:sensor domain-containing diguanylate cyclase [Pseudomonas citronellolis]MDF3935283.1 sensor domain-containing diguanylate cyclase [Pseudomonas citronellolis]